MPAVSALPASTRPSGAGSTESSRPLAGLAILLNSNSVIAWVLVRAGLSVFAAHQGEPLMRIHPRPSPPSRLSSPESRRLRMATPAKEQASYVQPRPQFEALPIRPRRHLQPGPFSGRP